jgi:hypothetical protein
LSGPLVAEYAGRTDLAGGSLLCFFFMIALLRASRYQMGWIKKDTVDVIMIMDMFTKWVTIL